MSIIRTKRIALIAILTSFSASLASAGIIKPPADTVITPANTDISTVALSQPEVVKELGWVSAKNLNRCGGYYLETPFTYSEDSAKKKLIEITSGPSVFAPHGTSILGGDITVTQYGQEVLAKKAYLYRDPTTGKISAIDLFSHVKLREPGSLIIANTAHLDLKNKSQQLDNIYYRTTVYSSNARPARPSNQALQLTREVTQLSAWGKASEFSKDAPKIYKFKDVSYSTCPPDTRIWRIQAQYIELNKNTGRGTAHHGRLYVKDVPVFYAPYLNFPIDDRRQTGFLFPTMGTSNRYGLYLQTPFYWNIAPNYDTTITPLFTAKRTLQINDLFRYLTPTSAGRLNISVTPDDQEFRDFQEQSQTTYQNNASPIVQANLRRLEDASLTRGALSWGNHTQFNENWTATVDYNRITDDYYLRDFGNSLKEFTDNQLQEEARLDYKNPHWNFITRVQQYQTLHPVDVLTVTQNQYQRYPQLVLNGDYSNNPSGVDYFISNEVTQFDIRPTPGFSNKFPIGKRLYTQPGVSVPLTWPYLYIVPRAQFSLTQYLLGNVSNLMSKTTTRALPILDISTGMYFDRNITLFNIPMRQTLEPQLYYLYVPYRNQDQIPIMDTTTNTLTYNQLFTYNRFSGLDRIGDANQITLGLTTRFIDDDTGLEKVQAGVAEIAYFEPRRVTICTINTPNCLDAAATSYNKLPHSPVSGLLSYQLNPTWSLTGNSIWDSKKNQMNNQNIALQYHPDSSRVLNLAYNFVRNGDTQPNTPINSSLNNLKQVDISFAWPLTNNWSTIGRWTKSINEGHFRNLIFGLQYDSCCWATRFVGGKTFTNLDSTGTPQYYNQIYLQFALRGLGNFGSGDPSQYISSNVTGYSKNFGQDF